jgi:hypothetical protein
MTFISNFLRILLIALTCFLIHQTSYAQVNLDSGLVGFFKLDSNYADSSSHALHGTSTFTTHSQGIHGLNSTGMQFNGSSSKIGCNSSNRSVTNTITLSAWVKTSFNSSINQTIISKYDWGVNKGYLLRIKNGYPDIHGRNNGSAYTYTTNTTGFVADGIWHHVMAVIAGNKWEIWVDGVLEDTEYSTALSPLLTNNYPTHIGAYYDGNYHNFMLGDIDEVRIYSRELLSTEISYLSNQENNAVSQGITNCGPVMSPWDGSVWITSGTYVDIKYGSDFADSLDIINFANNSPDTSVYQNMDVLHAVSNSNYSYQWIDCSNGYKVNGATDSIFSPISSGSYSVIVTKGNCVDTSSCHSFTPPTSNLSSGLVGYFKFDGNVADSSSQLLHGTPSNLISTTGIKCLTNTAYDFNGSSSKVVCGTNNRGITHTVNISVWVKTSSNTGHQFLVEKYNWSVDKGYYFAIKNGIPLIGVRNTSGSGGHTWNANQTFSVADGQWHHLFAKVSQNNLEIWVDGSLKATSTMNAVSPDLTTTYNLNLGYYYKGSLVGNSNYFNGTMDEVRMYNRDLTNFEIRELSKSRYTYLDQTITACGNYNSPSGNHNWNTSGIYYDTVSHSCEGDTVFKVDLTISPTLLSTINDTICGTYTSPSGNFVWNNSGTYYDTLNSLSGCDSVIQLNLNIHPIPVTHLVASNCYSYTSPSGNKTWYSSGTYYDTLQSAMGCDSVLIIGLTILPYEILNITETFCGSYTSPSGNHTWSSSGTYLDLVSHANDCDTLYNINLTVLTNSTASFSGVVCNSFTSPSGKTWTTSGTYFDTIPNTQGCDSLLTFYLTINPSHFIISSEVQCNSYTWSATGVTYYSSGTFSDTVQNSYGCDSINVLNLTINSADTTQITQVSCDSFYWSNTSVFYSQTGLYSQLYSNQFGCDSLVQLNLTINNSNSQSVHFISCDSLVSTSGNFVWTSSGVYNDTLTNALGCDSVVTINLIINNSQTVSQNVVSCNSYNWSNTGITYAISGVYRDTVVNQAGCDSISVLNLTINTGDSTSINQVSCNSYYWNVTGTTYTQGGKYSQSFSNQNGCDSLVELNLTINNVTFSSINRTGCDSVISPSGTYSWNTTGIYQDTIQNSKGCDSIITVNLTIKDSKLVVQNETVCSNYFWTSNGVTYWSSGVYVDTLISSFGCDSVNTLNLTINSGDTNILAASGCEQYYWALSGSTYYSSVLDTIAFVNSYGCDSIMVLDLTINHSDSTTLNVQSCDSFLWSVNGMKYYSSGIYTEVLTNFMGCDSVVVLDLFLNSTKDSTVLVSSCGNYTWAQTGLTYSNSGVYVVTIQTVSGCDSIIKLDLTILNATAASISETSCGAYTSPDGIVYSSTGQYQAIIANGVGCDSIITINLMVTHTDTTVVQVVSELHAVSNSDYQYQWIDCGNNNIPIAGETDSIFSPTVNGIYAVEITNGSCFETSNCFNVTNVGVDELWVSEIALFPNPVTDELQIRNSGIDNVQIEIFDVAGKSINRLKVSNGTSIIDFTKANSGVYIVKIIKGDTYRVEKIIVR